MSISPESRRVAGRLILAAALGTALLLMAGLLAVAMSDPQFLIGLLPAGSGRALQVAGGVLLLTPIAAAVAAHLRGSDRAAGWFVVVALLLLVPAAVTIRHGADVARRAEPVQGPTGPACVERSGGQATCPGG